MRRRALISLLLIVIALAAYWPIRHAEFTNFDDDVYVTDNPQVLHGLTREGFRWAFTTFHACNWHPVTWLSHMADCSLFGENATELHLVSVGFHLANTLLLLLLLQRMTGALWRSAFVAALFALHPLHVESVAWIAERKDVLSTFFFFLTLLAYERYVKELETRNPKPETNPKSQTRNVESLASDASLHSTFRVSRITHHASFFYLLALVLFALGLMSKPMLVTLPFVLLLLDYWPLQRLRRATAGSTLKTRDARLKAVLPLLREKLPFFVLSASSSAVTFWAQNTGGAVVPMKEVPFPTRLASAAVAYVAYLGKAFWPTKLGVPYPFVSDLPEMKVALAVIFLLAATVMAFAAARRAPYVLVGWAWFVGTLVPVIGLVQVGSQAMADRYSYVPLIGVFVMVSWCAVELTRQWRWQGLALALPAAMILAGCFVCTRLQVACWRNNLTLFSHTLRVTENNPVAEQCFGFALALSGKEQEAIQHFDAALRLWPDYQPALLDRGVALIVEGRMDEAVADFQEAIRRQPNSEKAYYQLAGAMARQKKLAEAQASYLLALRCQPNFAEAHSKLGNVLLLLGDKTNAMSHLYEAVRINPDYAEGQYALGNELAQQQKFAESVIHLRAAIKAQPNYASALNDLAWLLATQTDPGVRNVPEAIRLARRACELTRNKEPRLLDTLGVAQSEAGQFSEAIRATEQAVDIALLAQDEKTAAKLRRRLDFYRKGEAYHAVPR
jgi:tetratricopeptide (TPR) repeat protein